MVYNINLQYLKNYPIHNLVGIITFFNISESILVALINFSTGKTIFFQNPKNFDDDIRWESFQNACGTKRKSSYLNQSQFAQLFRE